MSSAVLRGRFPDVISELRIYEVTARFQCLIGVHASSNPGHRLSAAVGIIVVGRSASVVCGFHVEAHLVSELEQQAVFATCIRWTLRNDQVDVLGSLQDWSCRFALAVHLDISSFHSEGG